MPSQAVLDYVNRKRKQKELRGKLDRLGKRKAESMSSLEAQYQDGGISEMDVQRQMTDADLERQGLSAEEKGTLDAIIAQNEQAGEPLSPLEIEQIEKMKQLRGEEGGMTEQDFMRQNVVPADQAVDMAQQAADNPPMPMGNVATPEEEGQDFSYREREILEGQLDRQQNQFRDGGIKCAEGCKCEACKPKMADGGMVDPYEQMMTDYPDYLQPDQAKIDELEEEKRKQQIYGGIGSGLSQIAAAVAGGGTKPTAMKAFEGAGDEQEKKIQELKGQPAERLKKLMLLRKLKGESSKGGFSYDPESARSKQAAERIGKALNQDLTGMSEAQIGKIAPGLMASARSEKVQAEKEKRSVRNFTHKKEQKFQDDIKDTIKMTRGTKAWQQADEAIAEMPTLRVLLDDAKNKGGQSLAMLGPKIARSIANEVGVLTEQDVTRYVKNPELVQGLMDTKDKWVSGKLSEASYENLSRLLDIVEETAKRKKYEAIKKDAELFARREKMELKDVLPYFNAQVDKIPSIQEGKIMQRRSDGKKFQQQTDGSWKEIK